MTQRESYQIKITESSPNELFQHAKKLLIQQYAGFNHNSWKLDIIDKESQRRKLFILEKAHTDSLNKIKYMEENVIGAKVIDENRLDFMSDNELLKFLESTIGTKVNNFSIENVKDDRNSIFEAFGLKAGKTFLYRIKGDSMKNVNIINGSTILVDASQPPEDRNIVVASIFGELFVKRYRLIDSQIWLYPENDEFEPVRITPDINFALLGVVKKVVLDVN